MSFDVEPHGSCNYDWVEVFDGKDSSSKSLGKFCSNTKPPSLQSSSNMVMIQMVTDYSVTKRGFVLDYEGRDGK